MTSVIVETTLAPRPSWISLSPGLSGSPPDSPFRDISAFDLFRDEPIASDPWRFRTAGFRLPVSRLPTRSEFVAFDR